MRCPNSNGSSPAISPAASSHVAPLCFTSRQTRSCSRFQFIILGFAALSYPNKSHECRLPILPQKSGHPDLGSQAESLELSIPSELAEGSSLKADAAGNSFYQKPREPEEWLPFIVSGIRRTTVISPTIRKDGKVGSLGTGR